MTPALQTTHGKMGNCFAACIATLFDRPITDFADLFPAEGDFDDRQKFNDRVREGMAMRGWDFFEVKAGKEPFSTAPADGVYVLLGATSPNDLPHTLVGQVFHEPANGGRVWVRYKIIHCPLGTAPAFYADKVDAVIFLTPLFSDNLNCGEHKCDHEPEEHRAFDSGVSDGNNGENFRRRYGNSVLQEAYDTGRDIGDQNWMKAVPRLSEQSAAAIAEHERHRLTHADDDPLAGMDFPADSMELGPPRDPTIDWSVPPEQVVVFGPPNPPL